MNRQLKIYSDTDTYGRDCIAILETTTNLFLGSYLRNKIIEFFKDRVSLSSCSKNIVEMDMEDVIKYIEEIEEELIEKEIILNNIKDSIKDSKTNVLGRRYLDRTLIAQSGLDL